MSRSCHLYAGCHSSSSQVSLEFVVELPLEPSFDIIFPFRHFINGSLKVHLLRHLSDSLIDEPFP